MGSRHLIRPLRHGAEESSHRGRPVATHRGITLAVSTIVTATWLAGSYGGALAGAAHGRTVAAGPVDGPVTSPVVTPLPSGVVAEIPLDPGVAPFGIISDGTAIWVTAHRGTTLYRIDPTTNEVAARIDLGTEACGMPVLGAGRLWLEPCHDSTKVIVVDTTTNQIVGDLDETTTVGVTNDAVWATGLDGHTVARYDPHTLALLGAMSPADPYDSYVAAGDDVWGVESLTDKLDRLDPSNGQVLESLAVPGFETDESLYPAVLEGGLWLKGYKSGALVRMDLETHDFAVYDLPGYARTDGYYDLAPTAALGSIWTRISDRSALRVDPATGTVIGTYPAGPGGGAVAVDFGSLWVANFDSDTVWREQLGQ